jgi:hypothetical protein
MPRFTPELLVLGIVLLAVSGIAGYAMWSRVPPRLDPWAALDIRDEPAPVVTRMKLARLQRERRLCDAALATAGLRVARVAHHQSAPTSSKPGGCPLSDVIYVAPENRVFGAGFHATCPLAVGLAMFVRHTMQPAARRHLGSEIARIEHLGTYSCRPVRGAPASPRTVAAPKKKDAPANGAAGAREAEANETAPMSEHALANAIDIIGFVTRDGRRVRVGTHWRARTANVVPAAASGAAEPEGATSSGAPKPSRQMEVGVAAAGAGEDSPEAKFLREVRDGACDVFHAVLGPDFNAAHRDHFHLDMGRHKVCR